MRSAEPGAARPTSQGRIFRAAHLHRYKSRQPSGRKRRAEARPQNYLRRFLESLRLEDLRASALSTVLRRGARGEPKAAAEAIGKAAAEARRAVVVSNPM